MGCGGTSVLPKVGPVADKKLISQESEIIIECDTEEAVRFTQIFDWVFDIEIERGRRCRRFILSKRNDNHKYYAKVYDKANIVAKALIGQSIVNELEVLIRLKHKNILPIIEVIDDDVTNSLIFITSLALKGDIEKECIDCVACFRQIGEALKYCHSQEIAHLNLNLGNILWMEESPDTFCLCGFDRACELTADGKAALNESDPVFLPPEVWLSDKIDLKSVDVWKYGVCLFKKVCNCLPFGLDQSMNDVAVRQHLEEDLQFPEETDDNLKDLLSSILQKDPVKRPSFEQILSHQWFIQ